MVDPERYAQIVEVAQAIVNAHLGLTQSVDEAVPMFVDVDSSADLC